MGAAVLMLLPHAPLTPQAHPFPPWIEWGAGHSCSQEVQLQQLAPRGEQRKPRNPEPTLLPLSRHLNSNSSSLKLQV